MQISVTAKNLDIPDHVRDEAVAKLSRVQRVFGRFMTMEIAFSEESNPRITDSVNCDVVLHAKGRYLRASGSGPDVLSAADQAESKLARQARKLKTRLVSRPRLAAVDARAD